MKKLEINDMIQISYRYNYELGPQRIIVKIVAVVDLDSYEPFKAHIIIPPVPKCKHRKITFFAYDVLKNFGPLTEDEFIEAYPEYTI